jgi:putative selenium metabolism hydrolase
MITQAQTPTELDLKIARLAARDLPRATEVLKEAIRIPADHVDAPAERGGDPRCGLSNHEGPRIDYLRRVILDLHAVRRPEDVGIDEYGNLAWVVDDPADGMPRGARKIVYFDGHVDTVRALRPSWLQKIGGGIDPYLGLVNPVAVNRDFLRSELGYLPPDDQWNHLLFGRGSADQLGGVVAQIFATRILLELAGEGALRGIVVRSYATAAEEDNDGGGPLYISRRVLPGAPPDVVPDVVILTEGTGDSKLGSLGIYRGQRGRMQIEVAVRGRSCHGSMPHEGLNPLEWGGRILDEAARRHAAGEGFLDHPFLGRGSRTASTATLETPSDCAVPERLTFRFDRRLTVGETPAAAVKDIEALDAVKAARAAGLDVAVSVPTYDNPTWTGYRPGNPQIYMGWITPEEHPAIRAAVESYRRVVSPNVAAGEGLLHPEPRVSRWIFSTDGVGFPIPVEDRTVQDLDRKGWVTSGAVKHPAMFGLGPGVEQNTHKIGECVDLRELRHSIAFLARYPGVFAG